MTPLLLALLNALRGAGRLPRWAFFPLCGLATLPLGWPTALVVTAGLPVYFAAGWHFDAITGRDTLESPVKVRWINAVVFRLLPRRPGGAARVRLRGTAWLALRGLHLYPTFAALAVLHPAALLCGLGCLLQGPVYWLAGRLVPPTHAVRAAEFAWFGLVGVLLTLAAP